MVEEKTEEPKSDAVVEVKEPTKETKEPTEKLVEAEVVKETTETEEVKVEPEPVVPKVEIPHGWVPKTSVGKRVASGESGSIMGLFEEGVKIREPEIIDVLLPELGSDIILIGGTTGKGGGIKRIPSRRTSRMHKSGRRYNSSAMVVVGNKNGVVGLGMAAGPGNKARDVITKATNQAKLGVIPIRRGCGSWECKCGGFHSIPFTVTGRSGSVTVELKPAPKGVGLVLSTEMKKILTLAGIEDVWCKTRGQTSTRVNFARAIFDALLKLNAVKVKEQLIEKVGIKVGVQE